jgi:lysylphosphatidylglycerol synthetase-like protein (DUF2156 family)
VTGDQHAVAPNLQCRVVKLGWDIAKGVAPMRILLFMVFCVAALWLGHVLFFKSRYSNEVWFEMNQEAQKINYDIRRWIKF